MFQLSSDDIKKERMFLTGSQGVAAAARMDAVLGWNR